MIDVACVVLDIDDTLYLERDYVRSGFAAVGALVLQELGSADFEHTAWTLFERGVRGRIFNQALDQIGASFDDALIGRLVERYRSHVPTISLLPDARDFLDRVSRYARLAYVTDGPRLSQQRKVEALDLRNWSQLVVITDELGPEYHKPSTKPFSLIERQVGESGERCAYIADNPAKDFIGPKRLGWRTVRIRRPASLHADVPNGADIDRERSALSEVLEIPEPD